MQKYLPFFLVIATLAACKKNATGEGTGACTKIVKSGTHPFTDKRHVYTSLASGDKIVFAGGFANGVNLKFVDIYDAQTNVWTKAQLSEAREAQVGLVAGNKMLIAPWEYGPGVNYTGFVDIYNIQTGAWTKITLSEGRARMAMAVAGNKVVFAGGETQVGTPSKKVDIYDVQSGATTQANLFEAKRGMRAGVSGNKIFLAGGITQTNIYSKKVYIYDVQTSAWDSIQLSEGRTGVGIIAAGNKVVFAGGQKTASAISTVVDIYDVQTHTLTTKQLSGPYSELVSGDAAVTAGNKILFTYYASKTVDIYDVQSGSWTTKQLSAAFDETEPAVAANKILFSGGHITGGFSKTVDIFDAETGNWTTTLLSEAREDMEVIVAGNKVLFAGGQNNNSVSVSTIDIYDVKTGASAIEQLSKITSYTPKGLTAGDKILFAISSDNEYQTTVDIFSQVKCN